MKDSGVFVVVDCKLSGDGAGCQGRCANGTRFDQLKQAVLSAHKRWREDREGARKYWGSHTQDALWNAFGETQFVNEGILCRQHGRAAGEQQTAVPHGGWDRLDTDLEEGPRLPHGADADNGDVIQAKGL